MQNHHSSVLWDEMSTCTWGAVPEIEASGVQSAQTYSFLSRTSCNWNLMIFLLFTHCGCPKCTMLLSIEIRETKQCTVLLVLSFEIKKGNGWIFLNFQLKVIISIFTGVKLQIFCQTNNVYTSVMQNIGYFWRRKEGDWETWIFLACRWKPPLKKN